MAGLVPQDVCDRDASEIKREVIQENAEENMDTILPSFAFVDVSTCTVESEKVVDSYNNSNNFDKDEMTKSSHSHLYHTLSHCSEKKGIKVKEDTSTFLDVKMECDEGVDNCDCPSSHEGKNLQKQNDVYSDYESFNTEYILETPKMEESLDNPSTNIPSDTNEMQFKEESVETMNNVLQADDDTEPLSTENGIEHPASDLSLAQSKGKQRSNKTFKEIAADAADILESCGSFKTRNTSSKETDGFENIAAENKQLRLQVEELQAKLNVDIVSCMRVVNEKLGNIQNQLSQMDKKIDLRFSKIEESISVLEAAQSLPSTSGGISSSASKLGMSAGADDRIVELGNGLYCSTYCYRALKSKEDIPISAWVVTFLRGCFGEEAHLVRWRRSPGTMKLTGPQKIVASSLFRQWLEGVEVPSGKCGEVKKKYSENAITELCLQFPSYLGDRAYSLGLPLKESDAGQSAKKHLMNTDNNTLPKPKRRYVRKGEQASE